MGGALTHGGALTLGGSAPHRTNEELKSSMLYLADRTSILSRHYHTIALRRRRPGMTAKTAWDGSLIQADYDGANVTVSGSRAAA
jgi:hypothetical protein